MYSTVSGINISVKFIRVIVAQHWGVQTILATHLRSKYKVPPRCPTLIVLVSTLFLLYFPCLLSLKGVDVSSRYFFLTIIIDKSGHISLCNIHIMYIYQTMHVWLGMFNGFHSVQTHHNTELVTIFLLYYLFSHSLFQICISWSHSSFHCNPSPLFQSMCQKVHLL